MLAQQTVNRMDGVVLPAAMHYKEGWQMKRTICATMGMVVLLAVALLRCGGPAPERTPAPPTPTPLPPTPTRVRPTPTPEEEELNYTNPDWGLAMWCPEDWVIGQQGQNDVFFGTSPEAAMAGEGELVEGAQLQVIAAPMGLLGAESLEDFFDSVVSQLDAQPQMGVSEVSSFSIGGEPGLLVWFEGVPEGGTEPVTGFSAATEYERWGYLFIAGTTSDESEEHGPVLAAVLDSVEFMGR